MTEPKYVYVTVRLHVTPKADEQDIVQECDYSFSHEGILGTEIVDVETAEERQAR